MAALSEELSKDSFSYRDDEQEIEIPSSHDDYNTQTSMLSPSGSADTGHGGSPTSMAPTVTETDAFSDIDIDLSSFQQVVTERDEIIAKLTAELQESQKHAGDLQRMNSDLHKRMEYIEEHRDDIPDDDSNTTTSDVPPHQPVPIKGKASGAHYEVIGLLNDTEEQNCEIERLRFENGNLLHEIGELQGSRRKVIELENTNDSYTREITRYRTLHDDHVKQIDNLSMELVQAKSNIQKLEAVIKDLKQKGTRVTESSSSRALNEQIITLEKRLDMRAEEKAELKEKAESLESENAILAEKNQQFQSELTNLQATYDSLHSKLNTEWQNEREALHEQIRDMQNTIKATEETFKEVTIFSEDPASILRSWSYSDMHDSKASFATSAATETSERGAPVWKLLPKDLRNSLAEYAISPEGKPTACGRAIRKMKKLRITVEDDHFAVRLAERPDSAMSGSLSNVSRASDCRKAFMDASTDCDGLYVVQIDRNETPRCFSQESLARRSPDIGSRERLLMDEAAQAHMVSNDVAKLMNDRLSVTVQQAVNVSIQADEFSIRNLQQEYEVLQRTIVQLRNDLDKKNTELESKNTELAHNAEDMEELDQELKSLEDQVKSLQREKDEIEERLNAKICDLVGQEERLMIENEDYGKEVESLKKHVADLQIMREQYERALTSFDEGDEAAQKELVEVHNNLVCEQAKSSEMERLLCVAEYEKQNYQRKTAEAEAIIETMQLHKKEWIRQVQVLQQGNYDRQLFINRTARRIEGILEYVEKNADKPCAYKKLNAELSKVSGSFPSKR